ncbi:hypothetical protein [Pendulispora albinea]|uniref:SMP-30/Gluconolactonase/LRE-like region domain-containing protein n=1 Tax=Pendulispora albinea TaxID=2741071 RepID=A0ABZ2M6V0_9BACT
MARHLTVVSLLIQLFILSCRGQALSPAPAKGPTISAANATAPPAPADPEPLPSVPVARYSGFAAPESVLYDAEADRYLVSNVNGDTVGKDNNGFISVLAPDGRILDLKWIEGGKNRVKLDAPKGLALVKGVLYVTDISVIRTFDAKTGAPKGDIPIPGSTFLNDLSASPDGNVYVSDSGFADGSYDPVWTDAVYVIEKGRAAPKLVAKGKDVVGPRPNGLAWTDKGLVVCTFATNEIYRLDEKGNKRDITKTPGAGLTGIVAVGDSLLVTSWQGSSIYRGKLGGSFRVALASQKTPADIGYDSKRARLLVPHYLEDTVEAFQLD